MSYYLKTLKKPTIKEEQERQLNDWYQEYKNIEMQIVDDEYAEFADKIKKEAEEEKERILKELSFPLPKLTREYVKNIRVKQ
jgi:hypothetical protein